MLEFMSNICVIRLKPQRAQFRCEEECNSVNDGIRGRGGGGRWGGVESSAGGLISVSV